MIDLTTNTSAFGLCSDEWQALMKDYVSAGGEYQRYWQGRWEDVDLGYRHNLHKDRVYRAKPEPVVTVEVNDAFFSVHGNFVGLYIGGDQRTRGTLTTTFHNGKPVKAEWVVK
jgi:hypothetical protein